jgi:pyruvate dehydrogenase (quinone)
VTEPADLEGAVRALLGHDGPGIVDCDVNPDEPPMPGKVTYEQAKHFAQAFLRGQPHRMSVLATVARVKISQLRA